MERAIGPGATITLDFALHRLAGVIEKMLVFPRNMMVNMNKFPGLVMSQRVLHALLTAIDGDDVVSFSHVLSQMQHGGGYDVWMNKDNAQLVAVPPLHRVVSKGSTQMLKQCVHALLCCATCSRTTRVRLRYCCCASSDG